MISLVNLTRVACSVKQSTHSYILSSACKPIMELDGLTSTHSASAISYIQIYSSRHYLVQINVWDLVSSPVHPSFRWTSMRHDGSLQASSFPFPMCLRLLQGSPSERLPVLPCSGSPDTGSPTDRAKMDALSTTQEARFRRIAVKNAKPTAFKIKTAHHPTHFQAKPWYVSREIVKIPRRVGPSSGSAETFASTGAPRRSIYGYTELHET